MKLHRTGIMAGALVALAAVVAQAEDKVKVTPVLTGLLNPSGLVAEAGTTHLLVSDSGAGRILCFHTDGWEYEKVITKFAGSGKLDVYGKGPMYDIGPLGLAFMGKKLVVGGGEKIDGEEVVSIFDMPPHGKTITADKATTIGPIKAGSDSAKGEGNFFGVAVTKDAIYITSNGDDTKGWILKSEIKDGKAGPLKPFIATKSKVSVDAPAGIAIDKHGHLVVGQMGEVNVAGDSLLTIYDTKGELLASPKTGLSDIVGLAYSPKSGKLYAIDFSWADPKNGGLYRIDLSGEDKDATVKTEKLCSLDKPAAMAFANDGSLYVAEFGTQAEGSTVRPGRLVKIEGDL
jgi:DNA-binding beta-propeller fold protein YncE